MNNQHTIEQLEELSPQELSKLLLIECYRKYDYDVQYLKNLLAAGADLEVMDTDDIFERTPLHVAAIDGHVEVVKALLEAGASLEAKDCYGGNPLHTAARSGNDEVVLLLLKAGASKEALDNEGWTPWYSALLCNQFPIEELRP